MLFAMGMGKDERPRFDGMLNDRKRAFGFFARKLEDSHPHIPRQRLLPCLMLPERPLW